MFTPSANHPFRHGFAPARPNVERLHFVKRGALRLVILPVLAIVLSGCHKNNADVSTTPAAPIATAAGTNPGPTGPVNAVLPTSAVLQDPVVRANLKALNARLYQYIAQVHQMPRSFDAFAAAAQVQIPPPPAGMRYVIYNASVTLGPQ